jgi:hydrogenase nickel incorporation protein HypA/HybF
MHEYHIVEAMVKQALAEAEKHNAKKVTRVNLAMDKTSGLSQDSVRMYFENISSGTILEGAKLEIKIACTPQPGPGLYIENIEVESG